MYALLLVRLSRRGRRPGGNDPRPRGWRVVAANAPSLYGRRVLAEYEPRLCGWRVFRVNRRASSDGAS